MPTIPNISFSVSISIGSTPTISITDTTSSAPSGFVGIVSITQPDNYTRNGDIDSPDISSAGGVFTTSLRLDSLGKLQAGQYTIKMTGNAPGYLSTDFTRVFELSFVEPTQNINPQFDVFTPLLRIYDDTDYDAVGYTTVLTTRTWNVTSTPTGTIGGSGVYIDLLYAGSYFDAYYSISFISVTTYNHNSYSWLSIIHTDVYTGSSYAQTPPTITYIIGKLHELRYSGDISNCGCDSDFSYAQGLLDHIIQSVMSGVTDGLYDDMNRLLFVLNGNSLYPYTPTNLPISPYDWGTIIPSGIPSGGDPFDVLTRDIDGNAVWLPVADIPGAGGDVFVGTMTGLIEVIDGALVDSDGTYFVDSDGSYFGYGAGDFLDSDFSSTDFLV